MPLAILETKKTMDNFSGPSNKKAQSFPETMIYLGLSVPLAFFMGSLVLKLAAQTFISLDSYLLARAQLYGQELQRCQVSELWPNNNFYIPTYSCTFKGNVTAITANLKNITWNLEL